MSIQDWIHQIEEGAGARAIRLAAAVLGFAALAVIYDVVCYRGFSTPEAMESAHLARQLAEGRGFSTDSIRPLALHLLPPGPRDQWVAAANGAAPDLSTPPAYPLLLAGLMKVLPFHFEAAQNWSYQPEFWIALFNQGLFLAAVFLVFFLARRLMDSAVAWLAASVFAGAETFWRFSVSGLSTLWLTVLLLGLAWCLVELEERDRLAPAGAGPGRSILWALAAGALAGLGGLSRYSFAWLILPLLAFVLLFVRRGQGWLCLALAAAFLAMLGPWLARNYALSGNCFGTAGYGLFAQIPPSFTEDRLERSLNPSGALRRVTPGDVMDKLLVNARGMFEDDLPRLGGSWISAFFLAGLLVPFRNPGLRRLRWFVLWSLGVFFVAQALGQTHLTAESPQINSENLLVLLAPLAFLCGASFFYILLDQLAPRHLPEARAGAIGVFVALMCGGYLFALASPPNAGEFSAYAPAHIRRLAALLGPDELMMSDIPWAVAWYGNRPCAWLTVDDRQAFEQLNEIKPVRMVFLTQRTTQRRFLSQMAAEPNSWGNFILECWVHRQAPEGFPLRYAPAGYLPYQMLLADRPRWQEQAK